jgi:myo-inositol 2-dehydrogenase/D-chiro-inositol 1-dehydrogenase
MKVALAGFGAWGQMHARALSRIEGAALAAIYCHGDASASAAARSHPEVPRFRSYEEMLARAAADCVIVAVPNSQHASFAVGALDAGRHVVLEKPLGLTLAECDAVAAAAKAAGRQVVVNHELRVSHQWGTVHRLIAEGEVGRLVHQHISLFRHPFRPGSGGWRRDPARVGSWSLEELVHFVDLALWFARASAPPARVTAWASGGELPDTVSAVVEWADGATAMIGQCLAGFEHHTLVEIAGEEGAIRTWWAGASARTETPEFALSVKRRGAAAPERIEVPHSGEAFELEMLLRQALAMFAGRQAGGAGSLLATLADARAAVALCLAIERGAREKAPVELAPQA